MSCVGEELAAADEDAFGVGAACAANGHFRGSYDFLGGFSLHFVYLYIERGRNTSLISIDR
jgi:hypothetical protein